MTLEEFGKSRFGNGDKVKYKNKIYPIAALDFEECLIAILEYNDEDFSWKRCENCELLEEA